MTNLQIALVAVGVIAFVSGVFVRKVDQAASAILCGYSGGALITLFLFAVLKAPQ